MRDWIPKFLRKKAPGEPMVIHPKERGLSTQEILKRRAEDPLYQQRYAALVREYSHFLNKEAAKPVIEKELQEVNALLELHKVADALSGPQPTMPAPPPGYNRKDLLESYEMFRGRCACLSPAVVRGYLERHPGVNSIEVQLFLCHVHNLVEEVMLGLVQEIITDEQADGLFAQLATREPLEILKEYRATYAKDQPPFDINTLIMYFPP